MNFSLIVPAAGNAKGSSSEMPRIFMPDKNGIMLCVKSILGLHPENFSRIIFTILREHVEQFDIDQLLRLQFKRLSLNNAEILIVENPTNTQAETIKVTIEKCGVSGPVFFKDADCYFEAEIYPENGIAVCSLESLPLVDPRNKSYVAVDDMQHVTNIIEKRIVSHLFNAGGYCFADVKDYLEAYEKYSQLGKIYLSHLIYGMLLDGYTFRPIEITKYKDFNIY